jgi:hypothetical protein
LIDTGGSDEVESFLGAITLTALSEGAMSVSHKLVRTSTGDSIDFESEIDMLKNGMMTVLVKVFDQSYRILGIAIVADTSNLSDSLDRIWCSLNKFYFHPFPPNKFSLRFRLIEQ